MPNTIVIIHNCGHENSYTDRRESTGSFRRVVPVMCPECEEKADALTCAICRGEHPREQSLISSVAGVAVGKECLQKRG